MAGNNSRILIGSLVAGGLITAGIIFKMQPPKVETILPISRNVITSIAASGRLRGDVETNIGAQTGGRVARVLVHEGDKILTGTVVAELDTDVLGAQLGQATVGVATAKALLTQTMTQLGTAKAQVMSAQDTVRTAKASLAQASRPPLRSEVNRLKADVDQAIAVAEAKQAAARNRLSELRNGATKEERDQARAQLAQANAQFEQAEKDFKRQQALVKEGAVSKSALDAAETARTVAQRTRENADARLKQLTVGTRKEQIAQAEADLRAAEATLRGARVSGEAQLQTLLSQPRKEDVLVAERKVAEAERARILTEYRVGEAEQAVAVAKTRLMDAERALGVAQSRVADAKVKAPFDGTVTEVVTEPGGITGPNQPIIRLVRSQSPEIRIDLDEVNLGKINVGQLAKVSCDAFPGETFDAKVTEIGAQVDADRGTVEVRLIPTTQPAWLRPGQTLSVNIVTDSGSNRLVIPLTAVNTIGGESTVLVVDAGKVVKKVVKVGPAGKDGVPVTDGIAATDQVIVTPTGRKPGDSVTATKSVAKN
jgi:RND family efflux transporter MFP subunit